MTYLCSVESPTGLLASASAASLALSASSELNRTVVAILYVVMMIYWDEVIIAPPPILFTTNAAQVSEAGSRAVTSFLLASSWVEAMSYHLEHPYYFSLPS